MASNMRISDAAAQKAASRTAAALTARSVAGQSPMPMPLQNSWTPAPHQLHSAPSAEATARWAAALTVTARLLRGGGGSAEGGGGGGSTETVPNGWPPTPNLMQPSTLKAERRRRWADDSAGSGAGAIIP